MRKKLVGIFFCVLMMVCVTTPVSRIITTGRSTPLAGGNILYVGGSGPGNYTKIQDAIVAAESGDTVFVFHGIYYEHVYVGKSLNLIGENRESTIIDGGGSGDVVRLSSGHTNFTGFTVQHSGQVGIIILADDVNVAENILLNNGNDIWLTCSNNTISENILLGGGLYITHSYGHQNIVTGNVVKGRPLVYLEGENNAIVDAGAGQIILIDCENITVQDQALRDTSIGILLGRSKNCLISHNTISHCFTGMDFFQSENNDIESNTITNITASGIHLDTSSGNTISRNTVSGSTRGSGILVGQYSTFNTIANNSLLSNDQSGVHVSSNYTTVSDNFISSNDYEGIVLYSVSFSTIQRNIISDCGFDGISASQSTNCLIVENTVSNCQFGIKQSSCTDDTITKNTLRNNSWSGIILGDSNEILISENVFTNNTEGIYLTDASRNSIIDNTLQVNPNGIVLISSSQNTIENNNIIKNEKGIYLMTSENNNINRNNFKRNDQHAFFLDSNNSWDGNYWNRPRLLPYPILGKRTMTFPLFKEVQLPKINFDLHPALIPYDIP